MKRRGFLKAVLKFAGVTAAAVVLPTQTLLANGDSSLYDAIVAASDEIYANTRRYPRDVFERALEKLPEIDIKITTQRVMAKARKIRVKWSLPDVWDANPSDYSPGVRNIAKAVDQDIMDHLRARSQTLGEKLSARILG